MPDEKTKQKRREYTDEFHVFTDWYLIELEGIRRERFFDDKAWSLAIGAGYRRFGKACKDILAFAGGNVEQAKKGTEAVGVWLSRSGLSWNADTVCRWFNDWAKNPDGFGKGR